MKKNIQIKFCEYNDQKVRKKTNDDEKGGNEPNYSEEIYLFSRKVNMKCHQHAIRKKKKYKFLSHPI